jgi:hypothetical protein
MLGDLLDAKKMEATLFNFHKSCWHHLGNTEVTMMLKIAN